MKQHSTIGSVRMLAIGIMLVAGVVCAAAQTAKVDSLIEVRQSLIAFDSVSVASADSVLVSDVERATGAKPYVTADTLGVKRRKRDWNTWHPDPQRALWLALVIPGGGQIYNRKYWKLPIFYGGIMGCLYAMNWNNMMYKDYSQAYLDIMDSDPTTQSYNKFLHLGKKIDSSNEERYKQIFKKRKDKFRRWRDLSFFCMVGVYALSVIDAYVDAELSEFDISKDLSLKVEPAIINNNGGSNSIETASIGLQCRLKF